MENLQNYTRYTGAENPVDKLVDTANLHPSEVLTEEEIELQNKIEAGDIEELVDAEEPEVTGVIVDESLKFIVKYKDFKA
jgi:hypothetical protein